MSEVEKPQNQNDTNPNSLFNDPTPKNIVQEMESSYLDYAMSVIISRALPDVRDGQKPVHRRILYAMHELGLHSTSKFRKSAKVVGEVIAKYHPHGDSPVYQSMVRMAQYFAMRYPLIQGQGNFGSLDGDSPAAMRYTEAKLEKISDELLADIDKETVDWIDNYDGTSKEPKVLPTKIPSLLLNGSSGIAVGMATSIAPHNLGELIEGLKTLIKNPDCTIEDLMQHIKGPDFPTGAQIFDTEAIKTAYTTGQGGIIMRAKAHIEERKNGKYQIIITEIPYQVNKQDLVTKIADLIRDKKIIGISDLRDESKKDVRIVIELKKEAFPKKILNQLYKLTPLQSTFNFNMIALVDNGLQPKLLDLKQILEHFLTHRRVVVTRRTEYELKIAKARLHILEGLKIALDHIDEIISTIRNSETKEEANEKLINKFKLTDIQAKAILEMRLQTLAGLERQKIEDELNQKLKLIAELEAILLDPGKITQIIINEFDEIKEKYADQRKTAIIPEGIGKISNKDTIPNDPMVIMLSRENYIKRLPVNTFQTQSRGGKGILGATTKEEDEIKILIQANNHDEILYFTNLGRVFRLPTFEIPQSSRTAKGLPIVNLLTLGENELVTTILATGEKLSGEHLLMCTTKGTVKKTPIKDFENVRKSGLIAIKLRENERLNWVKQASTNDEIVIITKQGKSIRFSEKEITPTSRTSMGVRGIRLKTNDEVIAMDCLNKPEESELLVIMENGKGKSSKITDYRLQNRGGTGILTANVNEKNGKVVGAVVINEHIRGDLLIISKQGQTIRLPLDSIPLQGRTTSGVFLMRLNENDSIASTSVLEETKINNSNRLEEPITPAKNTIKMAL